MNNSNVLDFCAKLFIIENLIVCILWIVASVCALIVSDSSISIIDITGNQLYASIGEHILTIVIGIILGNILFSTILHWYYRSNTTLFGTSLRLVGVLCYCVMLALLFTCLLPFRVAAKIRNFITDN